MSIPARTRRSEFRAQARNPMDSWARYRLPRRKPTRSERFGAWLDRLDERLWALYALLYIAMCLGSLWLACEIVRVCLLGRAP